MKKITNHKSQIKKYYQGFSLIEMLIVMSLFLLISGFGVGSYVSYYKASLYSSEVDKVLTLIKQTRALALKNPSASAYGVHIDIPAKSFIQFRSTYVPGALDNKMITTDQLEIQHLDLLPNLGVTNEIIFSNQTGKTENEGTITIGNNTFNHVIQINSQGLIN